MLDEQSKTERAQALGRRLREGRAARQWTLRQAATGTGISNGYLSLMEQGDVKAPSPRYLLLLAEQYGLPYDELMELAGHPSGPVATEAGQVSQARRSAATAAARLGASRPGATRSGAGGAALGAVYGAGAARGADTDQDPTADEGDSPLLGASNPVPAPASPPSPSDVTGSRSVRRGQPAGPTAWDDTLTDDERRDLLSLVLQDMRGFTAADIAQVRAFIAGIRASRRV